MVELKRTLSFPTLLIITINSIMGTGIFFLPAVAVREAGPASILSWLAMGAIAMITGLIFAELVGMYPRAGGVYEYTKQAFGTFPSFMFGWMTLVAANVTIAMLVVGAIRYLNPALPSVVKIFLSILLVVIFNAMAYRGMRTSAVMLVAFGFVTLFTLLSLTIPGLLAFSAGNLVPFFNSSYTKIVLAVFLVAETFFGWETATFLAEETKDPERTMPRALWVGTLLIIILSFLFVLASLGSGPWYELGQSLAPLSFLAGRFFGPTAMPVMSILVYLSIIGSVAGWIVSAPRLIMSLAQDKLFVQQLADIHPKFQTPHKAIVFQTVVTSILIVVGSASFETLLEILVPIVLVMYAGVIVSFILLRYTRPDDKRPFRLRGGVSLGVLALISMLLLIGTWIMEAPHALAIAQLGLSFILIGVPLYWLLTYFYNPDALRGTMNRLAYLNLWLENIIVPKRLRRGILSLFPEMERQHVLELGCGVGSMTLHFADAVGSEGKVTALDMSERNIRILQKRLRKAGHEHVHLVHDPHLVNRVHPSIVSADVAVSVGNLSYVQDLHKLLTDLHDILPDRGRFCFVEYIDMFWLIPNNPKWIKDPDEIEKLFSDAGFSVAMKVQRGLFWKYLYIYGLKESRDVPYV